MPTIMKGFDSRNQKDIDSVARTLFRPLTAEEKKVANAVAPEEPVTHPTILSQVEKSISGIGKKKK